MPEEQEKFCFIVCQIGRPGSPERRRADGFFQEVIGPLFRALGYRVERADHDKGPGMVTDKIVRALDEADIVLADLHAYNPNVMYEVGIRHTLQKPIIHMTQLDEEPPSLTGQLPQSVGQLEHVSPLLQTKSPQKPKLAFATS